MRIPRERGPCCWSISAWIRPASALLQPKQYIRLGATYDFRKEDLGSQMSAQAGCGREYYRIRLIRRGTEAPRRVEALTRTLSFDALPDDKTPRKIKIENELLS